MCLFQDHFDTLTIAEDSLITPDAKLEKVSIMILGGGVGGVRGLGLGVVVVVVVVGGGGGHTLQRSTHGVLCPFFHSTA